MIRGWHLFRRTAQIEAALRNLGGAVAEVKRARLGWKVVVR